MSRENAERADLSVGDSHGSVWKDCAECGSENTRLGPIDEECPIICEDCGAETEGINGWSAI